MCVCVCVCVCVCACVCIDRAHAKVRIPEEVRELMEELVQTLELIAEEMSQERQLKLGHSRCMNH